MKELDQRLASLSPKSPMSLKQHPKQNQTIAWQQAPQTLAGGQVLGTQMPTQGILQGQQVLLVPMQVPQLH